MELLELGIKELVKLKNEKDEEIFIPKRKINLFVYYLESKKITVNGYENITTAPRELIDALGGVDNFLIVGNESRKTFIKFEGITSIIFQEKGSVVYVDGKEIRVSNLNEETIERWEERLSEL